MKCDSPLRFSILHSTFEGPPKEPGTRSAIEEKLKELQVGFWGLSPMLNEGRSALQTLGKKPETTTW